MLVLTTFDADDAVPDALCAGASEVPAQGRPEERLISAIHIVADGSSVFAFTATQRLIREFVSRTPPTTPEQVSGLTQRELDVIEELARGLSNAEIARNLAALYLARGEH